MRNLLHAAGLAILLLAGLAGPPAAADDAHLKITVTNGADTKGDVKVQARPAGQHGGDVVANGGSGDDIALPAGTYDVEIDYSDGAASKIIWFDGFAVSGHVEKTVDVGLPVAVLHLVVTNGGADAGDKGGFNLRPAGNHGGDVIASARSGGSVRVAAGAYDVDVHYQDGAVDKTIWLDGVAVSGTVDRSVEFATPMAGLRLLITNGGKDVGDSGTFNVRPAGNHGGDVIVSARSGGTVRLAAGTYDVGATYQDGAVDKTIWLDGLAVSGTMDKTVEVGANMAVLHVVITNGGQDVGGNGTFNVRPAGNHGGDVIVSARSGGTVRLAAGTYDVGATYQDGAIDKTVWRDGLVLTGSVDQTMEVGVPVADVTWRIVNHGQPVGDEAGFEIRPDGNRQGDVVAFGRSGQSARLAAGSYDVDVAYAKGMIHKVIWLDRQNLSGKVDRTTDLNLNVARPTLSATLDGADVGDKARIGIAPVADREEIGFVRGGESAELEAGHYALTATMPGAEGTLDDVAIDGAPHLVVAMKPLRTEELKPNAPPPQACIIEVYGVNFDFDKSTLRADSDPVLQAVLRVFSAAPSFRAEVGGHTDNIGTEAYNMRLSEARAASVKAWLVAHGVAADRVTSRGYGDTHPLVANDNDADRFRNRRVELRRKNCK